jgi:hypothetical protein
VEEVAKYPKTDINRSLTILKSAFREWRKHL